MLSDHINKYSEEQKIEKIHETVTYADNNDFFQSTAR